MNIFRCLTFSYLDVIESAVSNGDCVLIESIGELLDPVLDPILGRNTIKKGRYIWHFFQNFTKGKQQIIICCWSFLLSFVF